MTNVGQVVHYMLPDDSKTPGGRCVAGIVLSDPMEMEHTVGGKTKVVGTTKTEIRIYPSPHRDRLPEQVVQADFDPSGKPGTWHFVDACPFATETVSAAAATVETSGEEAN